MPTAAQIAEQIAALPDRYIFFTQKEIRFLPEILEPQERILALTSGFMSNATWLAVCTDRRVVFLNRGMIYGLRQLQMNLDRIQSIDSSFGLIFGTIRVWDGATAMQIGLVLKTTITHFVRTVQSAMDTYKRQMVHDVVRAAGAIESQAGDAPAPGGGFIGELERLSRLHAEGALSLAEFEQAKQKLLGHSGS